MFFWGQTKEGALASVQIRLQSQGLRRRGQGGHGPFSFLQNVKFKKLLIIVLILFKILCSFTSEQCFCIQSVQPLFMSKTKPTSLLCTIINDFQLYKNLRLQKLHLEQGRRKHLKLWERDTSRALFSSGKGGHFLNIKRALLCLLQNLGGTYSQCPLRFLFL